MNYYQEIEQEITQLLQEEKFKEALEIINEELRMPYIPKEVQSKLETWQKECKANLNIKESNIVSFDKAYQWITSGDSQLLQAGIIALGQQNLRNHLKDYKELVDKEPNPMVKKLLLLVGVSQHLPIEVQGYKLSELIHPLDNDLYKEVYIELDNLLFKEPVVLEMSKELLVSYFIERFPDTLEEYKAKDIALSLYKQCLLLLNRELEWYDYIVKNKIQDNEVLALFN